MTDYPRFQACDGPRDECYRKHHGAAIVEWMFRAADWWLKRRNERTSELKKPGLPGQRRPMAVRGWPPQTCLAPIVGVKPLMATIRARAGRTPSSGWQTGATQSMG